MIGMIGMSNIVDKNDDGYLGANNAPSAFYNTTRLILVAFSTIFNNIQIQAGNKYITVPLSYASREKYLTFLQNMSRGDVAKISNTLPQMAYYYSNIKRDNSRAISSTTEIYPENSLYGTGVVSLSVVPYMMNIELNIVTKNMMDASQIFEQILPSFNPSLFLLVRDMQVFNRETDIEFIYDGMDSQVVYSADYSTIMHVSHKLSFTVKYFYYAPVKKVHQIKHIIIDYTEDEIDNILAKSTIDVVPDTANRYDPHEVVISREDPHE